jgi:hypothetical protein
MNGLTGMIMSSGRVSLLSGRIRHYRVGLGLTGIWLRYMVCAREPLGHDAGRLGRGGRARVRRPAGLRRRFSPGAEFK